jgi:hypothetical protein
MAHDHKHELIKSPIPAVNQFERKFIQAWNENMAEAVSDVLKYVASETANAIKSQAKKKEQS